MFYTRAFLSSTLSPSLFVLNFKPAFTLSFSCKSPPEWIFSHLLNQALLACSQTMNKHISTQMNAAKQARNEETRRRNMRAHNCQRSRFGFVARQLCGHHRKKWADRDLTALSDPRANPTRQIYKPRFARNNSFVWSFIVGILEVQIKREIWKMRLHFETKKFQRCP